MIVELKDLNKGINVGNVKQPEEEKNQDVNKILDDIYEKYNSDYGVTEYSLPDLELDKMEYDAKTDEEIAELAKNSLQSYYTDSTNSIVDYADNQTKDYEKYKEQLASSLEANTKDVERMYAEAKKEVSNQALKRGLARSSIVGTQLEGLTKDEVDKKISLATEASKTIDNIDYEINALETKKQKALQDFDITYAAKLAIEISNLTDQRDAKVQEVLKYNNEIKKTEAQYEYDKLKNEQDLQKGQYDTLLTKNQLESEINAARQKEAYQAVYSYLSGLSKKNALNELYNNPRFLEAVGDYYYKKLISQFGQ